MLQDVAFTLVGLALLVWSAARFVDAASHLARALGVSTLVIGLTVVAFGSSAPELMVSTTAALAGSPALAVGNVIGSCIANIGLVLGMAAALRPLTVHRGITRREFPFLILITVALPLLAWDGFLGFWQGALLFTGILGYLAWGAAFALKNPEDPTLSKETTGSDRRLRERPYEKLKATAWTIASLALLIVASNILVEGATGIARALGVSEMVIGITLVAIGTSLPELAATVAGVLKGEDDLVVGNIIGSNIFNILAVLGIPAMITPLPIPPTALAIDMPVTIALTLGLYPAMKRVKATGKTHITRLGGAALALGYAAYMLQVIYVR